jgi:metal-responsive CopG/Arc/MetJ family transcriptional regulator
MHATIRKSVRLPGSLLAEVDRLSAPDQNFSRIVNKALRSWVRRRRRQRFAELVIQSARQRTPEQEAEDRALVKIASQSGLRVLEKDLQRG